MPLFVSIGETPELHRVGKSQAIFSQCNSFIPLVIILQATISKLFQISFWSYKISV